MGLDVDTYHQSFEAKTAFFCACPKTPNPEAVQSCQLRHALHRVTCTYTEDLCARSEKGYSTPDSATS